MPTPARKTTKKKTSKKKTAKRPAAKKIAKKTTSKKAPKKKATAGATWSFKRTMAELKKLGTAQNRKIYARHGAPSTTGAMFGVSFANLYALQKTIKVDHELAGKLWKTGNADAQILGALIADPARATKAELEAWMRDAGAWFMGVDYFASHVARTPHALPMAKKWMKSKQELVRRGGYSTLNSLLKNEDAELDTAYLERVLATIEREIHASPNRAREAMNTAMICIGIYHDPLHKQAMAAAKRIGKVEVLHGDGTHCKDFIATVEIPKARAHREKMAARRAAKKTPGKKTSKKR